VHLSIASGHPSAHCWHGKTQWLPTSFSSQHNTYSSAGWFSRDTSDGLSSTDGLKESIEEDVGEAAILLCDGSARSDKPSHTTGLASDVSTAHPNQPQSGWDTKQHNGLASARL